MGGTYEPIRHGVSIQAQKRPIMSLDPGLQTKGEPVGMRDLVQTRWSDRAVVCRGTVDRGAEGDVLRCCGVGVGVGSHLRGLGVASGCGEEL